MRESHHRSQRTPAVGATHLWVVTSSRVASNDIASSHLERPTSTPSIESASATHGDGVGRPASAAGSLGKTERCLLALWRRSSIPMVAASDNAATHIDFVGAGAGTARKGSADSAEEDAAADGNLLPRYDAGHSMPLDRHMSGLTRVSRNSSSKRPGRPESRHAPALAGCFSTHGAALC